MAKLTTPKQLNKSLCAGHLCWAIRFDEIRRALKKIVAKTGLDASLKITCILEGFRDMLLE
jgi:hypothetical protein